MVNKREFLKGTAAVAAAASVGWPLSSNAKTVADGRVDIVVFNDHYQDARKFAAYLAENGAVALPTRGDTGRVWYSQLRDRVVSQPTRIAGMGTSVDLLILETLGREIGLKVRYRGEHDCRRRRTLTHRFASDVQTPAVLNTIRTAGAEWPTAVAMHLAGWQGTCRVGQPQACLTTDTERASDHPGLLLSWLLA